ncbi:universal stress protein [Streptomyces sp. TRM43335]|uniref:Universal stress protein n=1 Tax=Streptomyces taklimakanensis TaxID=2569853 RepID=A0A6G2BIT5_9ACTN|nr:universal stress protein [Streptomyces taklimakanensis]
MELPLLVGVDGSEPGLLAVDWAVAAAVRHAVPLRLVHAAERRDEGDPDPEELMAAAVERVRQNAPDLRPDTVILTGDPAETLVHAGRNALAVVVGSRGRGGITGLLLGSVGLSVAGRSDCPVVVVRGDGTARAGGHRRIVLGVGDRVEGGAPAARFAFRETAVRGCELHAVRTWRRPAHAAGSHPLIQGNLSGARRREALEYLDETLRDPAREYPGTDLRLHAPEGSARAVLLDESRRADLLVLGAHRRQNRPGLQLGMVAHAVLHHAESPVALVPEHI